jgi:enamine deaminase RidA (YjgF/YER057c/UK114 family)
MAQAPDRTKGFSGPGRLCDHRVPDLVDSWEPAMKRIACLGLLLAATAVVPAHAREIMRRPAGNFPISSSVLVPPGSEIVFLSGTLADPARPDAPAGSAERLGDTEAQAASVLGKLEKELAASGLTMSDVVKMNVFLVGDPAKGGAMDFEGLMKAYARHFGTTTQPNLPARTTVQVVALPVPGALVEVELVAARVASK